MPDTQHGRLCTQDQTAKRGFFESGLSCDENSSSVHPPPDQWQASPIRPASIENALERSASGRSESINLICDSLVAKAGLGAMTGSAPASALAVPVAKIQIQFSPAFRALPCRPSSPFSLSQRPVEHRFTQLGRFSRAPTRTIKLH